MDDDLKNIAAEDQRRLLELSVEFDERTAARHAMGAKKYGPVNFLEVDSVEMAIEEVLDLANYCRYSYIKLRMLQHKMNELAKQINTQQDEQQGFFKV